MRVRTDRVERFSCDPEELWARIVRVDRYAAWWPWLREFDGERVAAGEVWRCHVRPPAPYSVRFTISIDQADPPTSVSAHLDGDIVGRATLQLDAEGSGSRLRLVSDLTPASRPLRALAVVAFPLTRWSHDAILDAGVRQFREASAPIS